MKNMKNPETCHQARKTPVTTQFNRFRGRFIATVCAAIAVCFVLTGHASNILINPGFDQTPGFTGWSAHSTETWSYAVNSTLPLSPPNALWQQGLYGNGGAPNTYISYVYQTIPSAPGNTYTADAWFSQYVTNAAAEGGNDNSGGSGMFGNNMALYQAWTTNDVSLNTGYYEDGWVEVQFLSSSNTILADYKSGIINPAYVHNLAASGATSTTGSGNVYLNWFDMPVTNVYNPATIVANGDPDPGNFTGAALSPGPTNSLSNGIMTAPPGTTHVQFSLNLCQTSYSSGAPHWDNCTLNQLSGFQPAVISNLTPTGGQLFNIASTNFTFNVSSSAGTTVASNAIQVVENGADVSSHLKFSGNSANWNVTLPGLTSNTVYRMGITVNNSAGLISTASARFDTFDPNSFIVPAEDYNFNGGQFIQNPIPTNGTAANSYWGLPGTSGIDYDIYSGGVAGGGNNLLPNYPGRGNTNTAWQVASDPNLPLYVAQSNSAIYNVNIAYNNAGNWYMYTRNPYPSGGYYQVYARMSDGGSATVGGSETLQLVTSGAGTTNFATTNLGYFVLNGATLGWTPDWNTYYWVPLGQDASGLNPTVVNLPSGQQTLQLISGNGCNLIDFIFVPIPALGLPPSIKNFNPPILTPGQNVFVSTNTLTFTVSSLISTVATNNIKTYINGVLVPETFTGSSANWTVSVPLSLPANQINQTFGISVKDANGLTNGVSGTFDTFSQSNFMFEAEDFDFNGGRFIDNPIPTGFVVISAAGIATYPLPGYSAANSYFFYPEANPANAAIVGVDLTTVLTAAGELFYYRPADSAGTEVATGFLRQKFTHNGTNFNDFNLGFWDPGQWVNYTRTFPTNTYNVYGRLASGGAYSGLSLSLVTNGVGTPTQTTKLLGTFSDPNANGWQAWDWVPLLNTNGQLAVVSLGGTNTLQANNTTGVDVNANFYMLVPAVVGPQAVHLSISRTGNTISIQFPTQSGFSYTVLYSGSLTPANWQTLTTITGDGSVKTVTDTMGSSPRFYRVSVQ